MKEIWKDIPGYEGYYEVSNLGRVKSLSRVVNDSKGYSRLYKERILKPIDDGRGYKVNRLSKNSISKTYRIHKLVAIVFLGHKPDGHKIVVDHIDNNSFNNRLDNLQLITTRENTSKDRKGGSSKYIGVSWYKLNNKWESRIRINGKLKHLGYFIDEYEAHLAYQSVLSEI